MSCARGTMRFAALSKIPLPTRTTRSVHGGRCPDFIQSCLATGAITDAAVDRRALQAIINYWVAEGPSLDLGNRSSPGSAVAELLLPYCKETLTTKIIEPTDRWLKNQAEETRLLARQILLRLVWLPEKGDFQMRPAVQGVCDDLSPFEDAHKVLKKLVDLGVVREVFGVEGVPEYSLRSRDLMSRWAMFLEWLAKRREFRECANDWSNRRAEKARNPDARFWKKTRNVIRQSTTALVNRMETVWEALLDRLELGHKHDARFSPQDWKVSESYRDRNTAECRYAVEKRELEMERNEWRRVRTRLVVLFVILILIAGSLAIINHSAAIALNAKFELQKEKTKEAVRERDDFKKKEEDAKQEALGIREFIKIAGKLKTPHPQRSIVVALDGLKRANDLYKRINEDYAKKILSEAQRAVRHAGKHGRDWLFPGYRGDRPRRSARNDNSRRQG